MNKELTVYNKYGIINQADRKWPYVSFMLVHLLTTLTQHQTNFGIKFNLFYLLIVSLWIPL